MSEFAAFAEELAAIGRATALRFQDSADRAESKGTEGYDPVTLADRETEKALRARIEAVFPDHCIRGEEFGSKPGRGPFCWSLDPIDGTRAFVCGLPSWTILIALLEHDRPVLGAVDVPRLGELYLGSLERAELITASGRVPIRVSACSSLATARFSTTDPYLFAGREKEGFERLRSKALQTRYGYDAYAYARLAAGTIDLVVESGLAPHDLNALLPLVAGAGGTVLNWDGDTDFSGGRLVAAATEQLALEAISTLAG